MHEQSGTSTEIVPGIGGGGNTQPTQHPENTSLNILRRLEPLRRLSSPSKRSSSPANAGVRELKSLSPTSAGINEPKVEGSRAAHTTTTRRLLREVRRSGSAQSVLQERTPIQCSLEILHPPDPDRDARPVDIVAIRGWGDNVDLTWDADVQTSKYPTGNSSSRKEVPPAREPSEKRTEMDLVAKDATPKDGTGLPAKNVPSTAPAGHKQPIKQVNWLKDENMLPKTLPEARVMWFEYHLNVPKAEDQTFLATELLQCLSEARTDTPDRPIVFMAHAEGAIIIEKALAQPLLAEPILSSTAGIIFLAPHLRPTALPKDHHHTVPRSLQEFKRTKSDENKLDPPALHNILNRVRIPLACFDEGQRFKAVNMGGDEATTERFELPRMKLGANWSGRIRFTTPDNPHYLRILDQIQRFVKTGQLLDAAAHGDVEYMRQNIGNEFSTRFPGGLSRVALHKAVKNGDLPTVRFLLGKRAATIRSRDVKGKTALHLAVKEAVKAHGDKVDRKNKEKKALPASDADEMVRFLLEKGADVNATDNEGKSAQDLAADIVPVRSLFMHRALLVGPSSNLVQPQLEKPRKPKSREAIMACKGFLATLAEFYTLDEEEKRVLERPSVYEVLYHASPQVILDDARDLKVKTKPGCCWYHLPANNVAWVNDLFTQLGISDDSMAGQQHEGFAPHSRHMWPQVRKINTRYQKAIGIEGYDLAMFMPYLNFETSNRRSKMNQVIGVCHERNIIRQFREKYNLRYDCEQLSSGTPRTDSNENNELGAANRGSEPSSSQSTSESEDSGVDSIPSYDRIKIRNDKMLIKAYLKNASRSLHPRRTLDQFYYYMLEDTEERDLDQVVERWVKRIDSRNQYRDMAEAVSSADPNIFMVDQLWLWILKGREDTPVVSDTVITCFPQRWGQSTDDDVLQNILGYLETTDRAPITSMHDLVKLIITSCSNVFDRSRVPKELQFQEFFEGCIGRVADEETQYFNRFEKASKDMKLKTEMHQLTEGTNDFFDITEETKLLTEIKDIQDEINIILTVLKDQRTVLTDMIHENRNNGMLPDSSVSAVNLKLAESEFKEQYPMVDKNIKDFERMEERSQRAYSTLYDLLDLKQKQANVFEAHFARIQARATAKQGTTILVFTIVTIIFLPLSFMATFFALNVQEFPKTNGTTTWQLGYISKYLFGVSFAVIVPLIIIAFSMTSVINWLKKTWGECSKRVRKPGIPERFSIMWARGATRSIDPEVADGMSRMSS